MKKRFSVLLTLTLAFSFVLFGATGYMNAADDGSEAKKITTDEGVLVLDSENGKFKYQLDARLYLDAAYYMDDDEIIDFHSGSEVRRMRFALKVTMWHNWLAEIDVDVADLEIDINDAFIGYQGVENMLFRVGQFRSPFSLEELTSSRYVSFIERALPNAFAPGRLMGIAASRWGKNWQASAGIFAEEAGVIDEETGEDSDEGFSLIGRFSIAPLLKDNKVFHLGVAYAYRTPEVFSEDRVRFRAYPESKISKIRLLTTGKVKHVDHFNLLGLEAAFQAGPFHLQAEYITTNVSRIADSGEPNYSLSGGYVYGSFFLTGDSMPYYADQGEFGRVIPKKKGGAVELLARYSWIDLNDLEAGIEGGKGNNFTLGINWYVNPNVRFMLNYIKVNNDKFADGDGDWTVPGDGYDYDILTARVLIYF